MKTINIQPTWSEALNALLMLIENGDAKGRAVAVDELKKMAAIADAHVRSVDRELNKRKAKRK